MGPRRWWRGRRDRSLVVITGPSRFNGATPMVAWKARNRGFDFSDGHCFNGATPMVAWKAGLRRGADGGAGLASMGPRRWWRGRRESITNVMLGITPASMGPRRWWRGRRVEEPDRDADRRASMGPRRWWRGRPVQQGLISKAEFELQWGHADGGVEGSARGVRGARADVASMGPRRWWRGRRGPGPRRS